MLKPQMPNLPGVGAVTDTLDFVKNLWGSMSVPGISLPGMAAPTMSVDELDKKIADLKAVEAWLAVNSSMLRGTIQALEVQRGTIATLKSLGATLANAVKQPGANEKSVLAAAPYASAFFAQPAAEEAPAKPAAPPPAPVADDSDAKAKVKADKEKATDAAAAAAAVQMANPSAWWNLLQDQFKQAVNTAMSSEAMAGASAMAKDTAAKLAKAAVKPNGAAKPSLKAAAKTAAKPAAKRAPAKKSAKPKMAK
jgi:hypothetical protein